MLAVLFLLSTVQGYDPINASGAAASAPVTAMSSTQRHAWGRVVGVLESGGTLSIVMIGGSVARGHGCTTAVRGADECPYAARLVAWLRTRYPHAKIVFENRAVGGLTTGGALLSLPTLSLPATADGLAAGVVERPDASIILIDFAVNDAFESQMFWNAAKRTEQRDMYLRVKKALKAFDGKEQVYHSVEAATEALLRYLLVASADAALLLVESSCWRSPARATHVAHRTVAKHYGVPDLDRTHQRWALCDPHVHELWALCDRCLAGPSL